MLFHQIIALFWGMVIGFATAVPIGPVGIICVQRTMARSRMMGLVTGFGAALTDAFLASVGAFGITVISNFIVKEQVMLRIVGGAILVVIGIIGFYSKPKEKEKKKDTAITIIEHFFSAIILTGTNPLSAITFFVAFAGIGPKIGIGGGEFIGTSLVIGVFVGSCIWWLLLTHIADVFGHKIKQEHFANINKWFGAIIAVLGAIVLIGVLF
jgi:arginine exporter protein ArgO